MLWGAHWGRFVRTVMEMETDDGAIGLAEVGSGGESAENSICALTPIWSATTRCTIRSMSGTMVILATARKKSKLAEGTGPIERIPDFGTGMRPEYPSIGGLPICYRGTLQRCEQVSTRSLRLRLRLRIRQRIWASSNISYPAIALYRRGGKLGND
jgi:hypothetical protein